jgi:hypothetical protein
MAHETVRGKKGKRPCANDGCENLCRWPDKFCGACAGYEEEMTVGDRQEFIRGRLLTVAIAGPMRRRSQFRRAVRP